MRGPSGRTMIGTDMSAHEAAKQLQAWLDSDEEVVFTRRQIADITLLLEERKEDPRFVWAVVEAEQFYERILEREK